MEEKKGIQELFFPNGDFRDNVNFPDVLEEIENLNFSQAVIELEKLDREDKKTYELMVLALKNYSEHKEPDFVKFLNNETEIYKNLAELGFYFQGMLEKNDRENKDVQRYAHLLQKFSIACVPKIQKETTGYPENSINGVTWLSGACLDVWNGFLADYFDTQDNYEKLYNSRVIQSKMVFAIKNHYPFEVVKSVYNVGVANRKLGEKENAINCFMAVIGDIQEILDQPAEYFMGNEAGMHSLDYLEWSMLNVLELDGSTKKDNIKEKLKKLNEIRNNLKPLT